MKNTATSTTTLTHRNASPANTIPRPSGKAARANLPLSASERGQGVRPLAWLLLLAAISYSTVAPAEPTQLLDKKISVSFEALPFHEALREIETASGARFVYSIDQLGTESERVSLNANRQPLRIILEDLLSPFNITYKVQLKDATIFLKKQKTEKPNDLPRQSKTSSPLIHTITGTVTEATTGQPMPGVNILIKGTATGTTTDTEGTYSLEATGDAILIFSFIGYTSVEEPVGNRAVINITLTEESTSLKDVIINAGYYSTTKATQTGSISKVTAEEIQKQPVQNPVAALQGRVPGLEVTQATGVPGGNFRIRIRGTNSIANGNDPLFIIDGIPYTSATMTFNETSAGILGNSLSPLGGTSPLNNLNPADIESIEVLRDADATAIYGSRGSNGVILITTKKGQAGKTKVDFNLYTGAGKVASTLDQLNTTQYVAMRKEAFANDNATPTLANARDLLLWDTTRYADWQKVLLGGTANTTDAQLSVSGGDHLTQFSVGLGYHRETTVFPGNNSDQRLSARLSIANTGFNDKLRTTASVNITLGNSNLLNQDLTARALFLPPNAPAVHDEEGNLNWDGWSTSGMLENPLALNLRRYEAQSKNLLASFETGYSLRPNLEIKSRFGYTNTSLNTMSLTPKSSFAPAVAPTALNTTGFSTSNFQNWMAEPLLNWKPQLNNHRWDLLLGTQFLNQVTEGLAQTASGFATEALMKNLAAAPNRNLGTNHYAQYRYHAVFGRLNYTLHNKYILNITGRRDGSSRFGPGNRFANFGAVGAAWIFSAEEAVKNSLSFLSFGKLRTSYGITGNDQLTDYQYLDAYTSSAGPYQGAIGLTPVRLSNPNFAWETNRKLEAAIELGFLDDRITTTITAYRNRSSNQLVGYPLPSTTGFTSIQANFPATVQNSGVEWEWSTTNIRSNTFSWTTSLNLSVPRNKLLEFPNLEASSYATTLAVGEPLTIRKLYAFEGVDPATGLYTFTDTNEDGSLNINDQQTIRFVGQQFFGGLLNSITWKGFHLDFLFQFAKQEGRNDLLFKDMPGLMLNQPEYVIQRWQNAGDASGVQRFSQAATATLAYQQLQSSNRSVSDASFIRLKNLALAYSWPTQRLSQYNITGIRIFVQGQNLLTFTNYQGLDPETQSNFLPPLRVITAGLSFTF
jgi:TonB-dependent starch-binding outer membrane protein SusC